ncbi:hypothetical protein FNJ62_22620 [Streptomyces benahoarensis]|uniref:Uncharacterized protein n=1 Tax=Streptomyces benahoarensis TaxID=2595054 RepID=A0A553ZMK0_9ACTN|nr:hypothetical protein [Streptomyces benahoarensis]TSB19359.1 hypothetical protein FNJ62_22620 [Streptomyces benahoarensis]TSB42701.1 hypothetical protein FNZ23_08480 [Streptomyces benahoarensis]
MQGDDELVVEHPEVVTGQGQVRGVAPGQPADVLAGLDIHCRAACSVHAEYEGDTHFRVAVAVFSSDGVRVAESTVRLAARPREVVERVVASLRERGVAEILNG